MENMNLNKVGALICSGLLVVLGGVGCNSAAIQDTLALGPLELLLLANAGPTNTASTGPSAAQRLRGIWIAGGYDGTTVVNRTDLYDPDTNTYFSDAGGAMLVPRSFVALASTGSKIYAIGGVTGASVISGVVEVLDVTVENPTWTLAASLNIPTVGASAVNISGKLYVLEGSTATAPTVTGGIEELTAGTWSSAAYSSLVAADRRLDGAVAALNGVVYHAAGRNTTTGRLLPNNGWIQAGSNATTALVTGITEPPMVNTVANVHEQRWGCAAEAVANESLPGTFFIIGGNAANPATNTYPVAQAAFTSASPYVSVFRTGSTTMATSYTMLYARVFPQAAMVTSGSAPGLYVLGGSTSAGAIAPIEQLPISGASIGVFTQRASMATPRYGFGATVVHQ